MVDKFQTKTTKKKEPNRRPLWNRLLTMIDCISKKWDNNKQKDALTKSRWNLIPE